MKRNNHLFSTRHLPTPVRWFLALLFLFCLIQPCHASKAPYIPEILQPWVDWVLHGKEEQLACTPAYNDAGNYQCNWPSELKVVLDDRGGTFRQAWLVQAESWIPLPGDSHHWPRDVQINAGPRVVVQKDGVPQVQLQPGLHTITGRFTWSGLPEYLQVPPASALVSLRVNSEKITFPNLDGSGRLWLQRVETEEKIENRLKIECFRLIDDAIPARVSLYLTLDAAGSAREITLGPLYSPEKFTPLSMESPLPAKLEQDAGLRIQLRPGQYTLRLTLRHHGQLRELPFSPPEDGFWPQQEVWSLRARPGLRLVEIEGVPSIDPLQTSVPKEWQQYPAYRVLPGDSMQFKESKRGNPDPAPDQLALNRRLWLRFDGSGYTVQDHIKGRKNTNWRLEIDPALQLGRVAVDGGEQFITRRRGSNKAGVELRNGILNLTAESLYQGNISSLPATGWDHDFQKVKGRLHLPPGWRLLHAGGIDRIPHTWIKRWTLLDLFMVLIFTIALAKLSSKPLAAIALLTLTLTCHEPDAPWYIWPALLIGLALLKYLPEGRIKQVVGFYQGAAALVLVAILIPYSINTLRVGIYPQLARPWTSMNADRPPKQASPPEALREDPVRKRPAVQMAPTAVRKAAEKKIDKVKDADELLSISGQESYQKNIQVMQYDPRALTQTGPGIPTWRPFKTVDFSWSGPVTHDQRISFVLIGPKTNLVLAFVRVCLIILLALGMFGVRFRPTGGFQITSLQAVKMVSFLLFFLLNPGPVRGAEIPPTHILDQLEKRLLEKDTCFPACADIPYMHMTVGHDHLSMEAGIHVHLDASVPLPSHVKQWLPNQVAIDGASVEGMIRKQNGLWILVPAGRHIITWSGPIRRQNTLQIPLPLKPHGINITAEGWSVEGVHPDGKIDAQLQLKRLTAQDDGRTEILQTGILPPFALVERRIFLGLVWKVQTKISRLSPTGSGMVLDIPLMPGESVTTEGIRVEGGVAKINLRPDQTHLLWESFLEPRDQIRLEHAKTHTWTETWKVDVSPIFHMEYEGIPVILHKTGNRWYPTWHPWPGESVLLSLSRPAGIEGQTLTIQKSHLTLRPGRKTTSAHMRLSIKSSQGGQHAISFPVETQLQEVSIKGKVHPIRQEGRRVVLPITPGHQVIDLKWMEKRGMAPRYRSTPVDLGAPNVNAGVDIHLPRNRWPLFVGGEQLVGPAVLFWAIVIVIIIVAFGLSKTAWTPLKTYQWFLLGIGISMSNLVAGLIVVGWLIAFGFRKKAHVDDPGKFNLMQIGLAVLSVAAVGSLVFTISNGLLGHPDMNIMGNGSNRDLLRWYQDVSDSAIPQAWVFSIPMFAYRIAMLAWALWVSFWLVGILKWGWQQFTVPKIWKKMPPRQKKKKRGGSTAQDTES